LSDADRQLCDFAVKLTLRPGAMQKSDIETLHAYGFDDDQITIATQVIGYFNYINRIADGLGVDPEDWMTLPRDEWLANKARDYA
jgi:alkylhydroperoxidase family enzyme